MITISILVQCFNAVLLRDSLPAVGCTDWRSYLLFFFFTYILELPHYMKYTVFQKKRTDFETAYLQIIRIGFDDIWQKYSKHSRVEFACFSFHVVFFLSTFRLSNWPPKITRFWKLRVTLPVNMEPFSKEDRIWIKSLHECKGYKARQFITEFLG